MKAHIGKGSCPNIKEQQEIWADIISQNGKTEENKGKPRKGGGRNETFIQREREIYYGGIRRDWATNGCVQVDHTKEKR